MELQRMFSSGVFTIFKLPYFLIRHIDMCDDYDLFVTNQKV